MENILDILQKLTQNYIHMKQLDVIANFQNQKIILIIKSINKFLNNFQVKLFLENLKMKTSKIVNNNLTGDNKQNGLIQIVGQQTNEELLSKNNHIQCSAGLQLLARLMDYEFNLDAESYIQIFAENSFSNELKKLKLQKHISDQPANNCRQYSFQILKKYQEKNNELNSDQKLMENFEISYQSLLEYKKWLVQKYKGSQNQHCGQIRQNINFQTENNNKCIQNGQLILEDQIYFLLEKKVWKQPKKTNYVQKIKTSCWQIFKRLSIFYSYKYIILVIVSTLKSVHIIKLKKNKQQVIFYKTNNFMIIEQNNIFYFCFYQCFFFFFSKSLLNIKNLLRMKCMTKTICRLFLNYFSQIISKYIFLQIRKTRNIKPNNHLQKKIQKNQIKFQTHQNQEIGLIQLKQY
ncbi:hypothetical protein IMG5_098290 [Ichthyophthirius multifiliis]|uniref:Uncharacterized protein n=1 Tax=Ichthyophthirius multifiliis TaxID=5932 RepID=G0QRX3_ICHMU|nr:hypothetical protein IMG5_098290 [Ichthyophthirius multifiliis]EGR32003.1 hypothetical protein IMG5_098290 [Ichthyophthirius multifiliis]|eukprot:XP_004035489.1 hypothetical protein IMG5_098290 [Ichthyophthirius multifiliis]